MIISAVKNLKISKYFLIYPVDFIRYFSVMIFLRKIRDRDFLYLFANWPAVSMTQIFLWDPYPYIQGVSKKSLQLENIPYTNERTKFA